MISYMLFCGCFLWLNIVSVRCIWCWLIIDIAQCCKSRKRYLEWTASFALEDKMKQGKGKGRVSLREHTTQETTLHMDITRWSTPKSDWLYSLQPNMEKLYTVSKNKTRSWLWLRSWAPYCKFRLKLKKVGKIIQTFRYDLNQTLYDYTGFPDSSVGKESACNARDPSLIPEWARSAGERIGYPLQYPWASLVAQRLKRFLPCLLFLFSSAICKASSDNHFGSLHFLFSGIVLVTASVTNLHP